MDYTKFSKDRDHEISSACRESKKKVQFMSEEDICLLTKKQVMSMRKSGQEFYKKFTPYFRAVSGIKIRKPVKCDADNFADDPIDFSSLTSSNSKIIEDSGRQFYEHNPHIEVKGGRKYAFKILSSLDKLKDYEEIRNTPSKNTSKLSAYNKFGCISIRELYYAAKFKMAHKHEAFIRQLYWRDFYYYIGEFYPHIWNGPMKVNYAGIKWWDPNKKNFLQKWKEGKTGCPIVDASMRHLSKTGYMPNRNRMIVSNFLVKDLHINWQEGEKYFATQLVDYDPCQNNGGWQWSAGCGVDSQPYFRIFNPKLQSEKVDKECKYIKKWLPELKEVENEDIHNWEIAHTNSKYSKLSYPQPIVIHSEEKETCISMYVKALDEASLKGITTNSYRDMKNGEIVGKIQNIKKKPTQKGKSKRTKKGALKKESAQLNEEGQILDLQKRRKRIDSTS